ncbi:MAG: class I SAM-dependent methyltransferase [Candidatus Gottesmanbacteria bacterium]|nr:class I SAM-dependent methyltransferase [Candidatus Gottesmanbacteria bacterium]
MSDFKNSRKGVMEYRLWRTKRMEKVVARIGSIINFRNKTVLDVGCGFGSLTSLVATRGTRETAGLDMDDNKIRTAKNLDTEGLIKWIRADATHLPFTDDYFDVILMVDMIEHAAAPGKIIRECCRVLKQGGYLYVELTPYYSVVGHHLYDATVLLIHFLPERWMNAIIHRFISPDVYQSREYLNKLRIKDWRRAVRGLVTVREWWELAHPEYGEIGLPVKIEFLTTRFAGLYQKPTAASGSSEFLEFPDGHGKAKAYF